MTETRTHLRGFASLSPERRREISQMGGKAVPAHKRTYSLDRVKASEAGRKGGMIRQHGPDGSRA